jgi:hypothetical protein
MQANNSPAAPMPTSADAVYSAHVIGFRNDKINRLKHPKQASTKVLSQVKGN